LVVLIIYKVHAASFCVVFSWRTLNRISNCSRIRIWMTIFIRYYRTSLNVNAVFWRYSGVCNRTTLTTLIFWIWHWFIVILVRILLNIIKIDWISIALGSCTCWTQHTSSMILVLWRIWQYSILYSHCWIMLLKNLLLTDYDVVGCLTFQNLLLLGNHSRRVVGAVERVNWATALSW